MPSGAGEAEGFSCRRWSRLWSGFRTCISFPSHPLLALALALEQAELPCAQAQELLRKDILRRRLEGSSRGSSPSPLDAMTAFFTSSSLRDDLGSAGSTGFSSFLPNIISFHLFPCLHIQIGRMPFSTSNIKTAGRYNYETPIPFLLVSLPSGQRFWR